MSGFRDPVGENNLRIEKDFLQALKASFSVTGSPVIHMQNSLASKPALMKGTVRK